ncbi:MAG: hypothetical protein R6V76_06580 [Desulfobacterales bacterium]
MEKNREIIQFVWGIILILAGIGVFYRIPQVMPKIEKIGQFSSAMFFIRFCFYLLGILLIGGGLKKVYHNYFKSEGKKPGS